MAALTPVQRRALTMLSEDEPYYQSRRSTTGSPNWYHPRHQPGNLYVDARTARVLIEQGLAEVRYGRLFRTPEGTARRRQTKEA